MPLQYRFFLPRAIAMPKRMPSAPLASGHKDGSALVARNARPDAARRKFQRFSRPGAALRGRLAVSGHTHVGSVVREEGTIFLNPGSASLPKGRDPASCAIADGEGISILTLEGTLLHHEPWNL
jgi:predicted phosphodiesterase